MYHFSRNKSCCFEILTNTLHRRPHSLWYIIQRLSDWNFSPTILLTHNSKWIAISAFTPKSRVITSISQLFSAIYRGPMGPLLITACLAICPSLFTLCFSQLQRLASSVRSNQPTKGRNGRHLGPDQKDHRFIGKTHTMGFRRKILGCWRSKNLWRLTDFWTNKKWWFGKDVSKHEVVGSHNLPILENHFCHSS